MAIRFDVSRLTSRTVRASTGTRTVRSADGIFGNALGGGAASQITKIFSGLGNFLVSALPGVFNFSWSGLWSFCVAVKQFVWNFNWNATDEQLDASIKSRWNALGGQLGGTLGNLFGYVACGIVPGAVIFAFNEPLGAYVLKNVIEATAEEFIENMGALLKSALQLGTQILLTETFKNTRKLIKSNSNLVKKIFGDKAKDAVNAWGSAGSKPWSFASATEEYLDNTLGSEGWLREFAEEFLEEADEACVEAGYVVANSLDTWLSTEMITQRHAPPMGDTRYVEITPNRENPDERIVLGGREELLRPVIIQTLATYEQFNGRDLGLIYGTEAANVAERRHKPEVVLRFYRKQNNDPKKGTISSALSMQIAFRLMNKSKEDFATDDYLKILADSIHREFATPPFKIEKGKQTYTYADHEKGYQFKLDVKDEAEAKKVIKKTLDIQGHTMNDDFLRKGSRRANQQVQTIPDRVTIRGERVDLPLPGKEGEVTFQFAYLNVGVAVPPINLVDLTGKKRGVVYAPGK